MTGRERRTYQRKCRRCRSEYETTSAKRLQCFDCSPASGSGSQIVQLRPEKAASEAGPAVPESEAPEAGFTERTIRNQLEAMGLSDSWRAAIAIGLAQDLDRPGVTGAPRTSMSKQLSALMVEFEAMQPPVPDEIDSWQDAARKLQGS